MVGGSVTSGTNGVLEGHIEDTLGSTGDKGAALMGISSTPTDRTSYYKIIIFYKKKNSKLL